MNIILDYCYTERIEFPDDQLIHLITVSDFLQMERLNKRCLEKIKTSLTPQNVLQYLKFATVRELKDIKSWCLDMIVQSFHEVCLETTFLAMPHSQLQECLTELLQPDMMSDEILVAVVRWIEENVLERFEYLEGFLQRFQPGSCFKGAILFAKDILEAIFVKNPNLLHLQDKYIRQICGLRQLKRKSTVKQLVIIGGTIEETKNGNEPVDVASRTCWSLDKKQNKFVKFCDIPIKELACNHSVCEIPHGFALTGGDDSDMFLVYQASAKRWRIMRKMLRKRQCHASICMKRKLYVLCGKVANNKSKTKSVDCFDMNRHQWESLPDAPLSVWYPKVAELAGKLHMLDASSKSLLQCDVENNDWKQLAACPVQTAISVGSCMIAVNGQLCVAGGLNRDVLCAWYQPATNTWSIGQQRTYREHNFGSLVQVDTTSLLILGGHKTGVIEKMNIADESWSGISNLKMPVEPMCSHTALYLNSPQD